MFDESLPGPSTSNQSDLRQHIETISRQMMAQMEELRGKSFFFYLFANIKILDLTSMATALQQPEGQNDTEDDNIEVD